MLNCKQATEMASHGLDRQLSLPERIKFKFHLMICRHCHNYAKQLAFIRRLSRGAESHIEQQDRSLSPEAKAQLKENIRQQQSSD